MKTVNTQLPNLFLVIAALHILAYHLFIGNTAIDIQFNPAGLFNNELGNYFATVSILILLIWFSYVIVRKRLTSNKLILLHIAVIIVTVFVLPRFLFQFYRPMPRRYYMYDAGWKLNRVFGDLTATFLFVALVFIASEGLLLLNIRKTR